MFDLPQLDLPPLRFRTTGLWFTIPNELRRAIYDRGLNFGGALHALEHAMIAILPFEVMCDRWDIGGLSTPGHPGTGEPTICLYDGYEGGIGLTEKAQGLMERITCLTLELIRDCPCETGCQRSVSGCLEYPALFCMITFQIACSSRCSARRSR